MTERHRTRPCAGPAFLLGPLLAGTAVAVPHGIPSGLLAYVLVAALALSLVEVTDAE